MDKRLIDAEKLLEWLEREEIKNYWMKDAEGAAKARVLSALSREVIEGTFDPDPIPLPTIKPGDKVRHKANNDRTTGVVRSVSLCGQGALVSWYCGEDEKFRTEEKVSDLEVSHD